MTSPCPSNSFTYNTSSCACDPGYLYTSSSCRLFAVSGSDWVIGAPADDSLKFTETILSFDLIKKFTHSQALFLEVTAFTVVTWLAFCLFVRFRKLGDGRSNWFQIRWWISRLDICFSTRHWLDDQKVVKKRKTELGGTFSVASWILFIGLFAALLFQNISGKTVEIQNVRTTNAPELASFKNDMEFNITTISSMSCLNLRNLGTLITGNPGFADYRVAPLTTFANYSCQNSSQGPKIFLKCKNCQVIRDNAYISWQFVDLPNNPATAVGFQFNLTAKNHDSNKHVSFVGGMLKNGSSGQAKPVTYRGVVPNVLKFNLFPRIYRNLHNLKIIRPLFHEFIPGSSYSEISQLQTSLQNSTNGLVNITLDINFLSAYILEIDNENTIGVVRFLADLGGLYCISIAIFFYLLLQCEYRVKKLRKEDTVMRHIRNRRKAQDHWDKLRKYVMYTWGCKAMDDTDTISPQEVCCARFMVESLPKNGSSMKRRQPNGTDTISFNRKINLPDAKVTTETQVAVSCVDESCSKDKAIPPNKGEHTDCFNEGDVSTARGVTSADEYLLPPPPSLELKDNSDISMSDIKKTFQNLYEYNLLLRKKLIDTQSELQCLTGEASSSGLEK